MKTVTLTCVECPMGCQITVEKEGDAVLSVKGNSCPRGKLYATNEVTCPKRVVTSTVRTADGRMLPVKTSCPVPKTAMFDVIHKIADVTVKAPIQIGDVLVPGIEGEADLVATGNLD